MTEVGPGEGEEILPNKGLFSRRNLALGVVGLATVVGVGGCYINEVEKTGERIESFVGDFDPGTIEIPLGTEP